MIYDKALYGFGLKSVEEIKKRIQDMQRPKLWYKHFNEMIFEQVYSI